MNPVDFWDSTFDEVILKFKGKVDEWRVFRNGVNLIHCSMVAMDQRVDIAQVIPLPFDDEILDSEGTFDIFDEYERLKEAGKI